MRLFRPLQHWLTGRGQRLQVADFVPLMHPIRQWADTLPWAALVTAIDQSFAQRFPKSSSRGRPPVALAQAAEHGLQHAPHLPAHQRARGASHLQAALAAHHTIRRQLQRLTPGKPLRHCKVVHAYDGTIAPLLQGKSNCPAQCGRTPGIISEPPAGFLFATPLPVGNPSAAGSVVPLVDTVQAAITRVTAPGKRAIHAGASDRGANAPLVRQTLHARGLLTLGIPTTVEPIHPQPTPQAILDSLKAAGLHRLRTPSQVQLACACG